MGVGALFSSTSRYETAMDLALENKREDSVRSLLSSARLYATWSPWSFLKFYAGGGADIVFETDGPIPLPLIEGGISFKPLALTGTAARWLNGPVNAVYYERNSAVMAEGSLAVLDAAGRRLAGNPSSRITLRAYYAPRRTVEWQVYRGTGEPALSAARAEACAEYLAQQYGVEPDRVKIEYRQTRRKYVYRCVELIIK